MDHSIMLKRVGRGAGSPGPLIVMCTSKHRTSTLGGQNEAFIFQREYKNLVHETACNLHDDGLCGAPETSAVNNGVCSNATAEI